MDSSKLPQADSIHVVWLDLDLSPDVVAALWSILSLAEQQRVARLSSPREQRRATVRLARRRQVLAEVLDVEPQEVVMGQHPGGKPFATTPTGEDLGLSASHCGGLGLIAMTLERRIGVDVEAISELPDAGSFGAWATTALESRDITALGQEERTDANLRLWTRKEAYLKATGEGIGGGIRHIQVPLDIFPRALPFRPFAGGPWWLLYGLACPLPGYDAALVTSCDGRGEKRPDITLARR